MPRGIKNWNFNNVKNFLREYGFGESHSRGSHFYYTKKDKDGKEYVVDFQFHGASFSYPPLTMKTIIRQSGIDKREWMDWAKRGRRKK